MLGSLCDKEKETNVIEPKLADNFLEICKQSSNEFDKPLFDRNELVDIVKSEMKYDGDSSFVTFEPPLPISQMDLTRLYVDRELVRIATSPMKGIFGFFANLLGYIPEMREYSADEIKHRLKENNVKVDIDDFLNSKLIIDRDKAHYFFEKKENNNYQLKCDKGFESYEEFQTDCSGAYP